jgi:hypothetical protein
VSLSIRQQLAIVSALSAFGMWCLFQFHHAQEAKKRNYWMVECLVEAAQTGEEVSKIHDNYSRLTAKMFQNNGDSKS